MPKNFCYFIKLTCFLFIAIPSITWADGSIVNDKSSILYTLGFPNPQTHYVEVEAQIPAKSAESELMMATWTPGSYLIREFARQVEDIRAVDAQQVSLPVIKINKNRWRVEANGAYTLKYRIYAKELSVRTSFIDNDLALLNGTSIFITPEAHLKSTYKVKLNLPDHWSKKVSGLPIKQGVFLAKDYDTLVDSPITAGNPKIYEFDVEGVPHRLVNYGEKNVWEGQASAADVEKIVAEHHKFWGELPYDDQYVFLNMIMESRGGLEHKNSTVIMANSRQTRVRENYLNWLDLVSHEYFHAWNVKQLRPKALGPFDYEHENYTDTLWIAEGFTSYYESLLNHRAGLMTKKEYFKRLVKDIETLQSTPGRLVQPVASASSDAWIKHYRKDENSINNSVSYYTKGAVIGFLLDARIRELTNNQTSLDQVMQEAYQRFSGEQGYTADDFQNLLNEVSGTDLTDFIYQATKTTEELDYQQALDWYGLELQKEKKADTEDPDNSDDKDTSTETPNKDPEPIWLGLKLKSTEGRLLVTNVIADTPARQAGINAGDEIIALDGFRINTKSSWDKLLKSYRAGEKVTATVSRRNRLQQIDTTFELQPPEKWKLLVKDSQNDQQKQNLSAWLTGSAIDS